MELAEPKLRIPEVFERFPCVFLVSVAFPFDQVFVPSFLRGSMVENTLDCVFLCVVCW